MKQESKLINDQVFNLMDALRSPVLTHDQSWADCIPKRIIDVIPLSRMAALIKNEEIASEPEAVAFIMTACMVAPLDHEWTEIYTYISCKVCQDHFNENHWAEIKKDKYISDYQLSKLNSLRRWIYERRRSILKQEMKHLLKKQVTREEMNQPMMPVTVEYRQLELWDS